MKLSVWTSYYVELSPEDAVLEMKKHGIHAAELSDEHGEMLLNRGDPKRVGNAFRRFLEEENFCITQGHLWLKIKLCTDPTAVEKLCKWLELYEAIGIENAVLHMDGGAEGSTDLQKYDQNVERLKVIQKFVQNMKIRICLENLIRFARDIDGLIYVLDQLDPNHFGICLDTGHLNLNDKDQVRFIQKAASRLKALHIADNEGERDQHMMPFGKGTVDFAAVCRALKEIDYHGMFNLEIPGERNAPVEVKGYKLEYIRKCYEYLNKL
jgi:sugar phosphate isomerase/epimerase